ncbi:MAG: helix-turn-helix domain-containing protein [Treponema sp.]|nr:helix-turn-helix domain-containing protein [Treponema sp.]
MTNIKEIFAKNLKQFRQIRGWSQAFLAEKAEVSTNYIGMLENSVKFPSAEMVQKLAIALDIDPTDLFSKKNDHILMIKTYQKAALEEIQTVLNDLVNEKILLLEKEQSDHI